MPEEEAKGRKADRIIVLTDTALAVVQRSLAVNLVKEQLVSARTGRGPASPSTTCSSG